MRRDHYISGFDIAMNNATRMRSGERVRNLDGDRKRAAQIQRPAVDQLAYVLALNVLHDDKVHATNFVEIEDRADVRMIESGGQAGFALKTFEVGLFGGQFRRQDFNDY